MNREEALKAVKITKRPVTVEGMRWDGSLASIRAISEWAGGYEGEPVIDWVADGTGICDVRCWTLEGDLNISVGDWIIRGVRGEFYPCKPDIFEQTYLKSEAAGELVRVEDVRQWLEKFMGECIQGGLSLGEAFLYLDQQIKHLPRYPGVDATRRLQAAEKLADAGLVIVNEVQTELNLSKLIRASNKTIEGFPAIARLQKALADYRAATKEGK